MPASMPTPAPAPAHGPDGDGFAPITHLPKADDIAGIQALYGPAAAVPGPGSWALCLAGLGGLCGWLRHRRLTRERA